MDSIFSIYILYRKYEDEIESMSSIQKPTNTKKKTKIKINKQIKKEK